ncbi:MAG: multidrug transport protein, mfs family [Acidimicrobiaceae bacterium]|nr:MAG: multidrug transport protein, mfs family [Acidimicrobiaceae bacterium]
MNEPVDDDLDVVLLVAGKLLVALEELGDVDDFAIDAGPHVPLRREVLQQGVVLALATAHNRREHLEPGALRKLEDAIDDLLWGLAFEPCVVVGAVLHTDARVQQAQVVVDLGDRAHRGPGIAARRLLIDGDRR